MEPGTALAVVSLTFQLLGGCISGFQLLVDANNIGKVSGELLCLLSIQEARLVDWARRAGLLGPEGCLNRRLNANLIDVILRQLNELLGDVEKLSARYKFRLSSEPPDGVKEDDARLSLSPAHILGNTVSNETRQDILSRAKRIRAANMLPQRLWWAAVDEDKFRQLVITIQSLVHELWNLLDPITQDEMMAKLQLILAQLIGTTKNIQAAQILENTVALDAQHGDGSKPSTDLLTNLAQLKVARLALDQLDQGPRSTDILTRKLSSSSLSAPTLISWDKIAHIPDLEGLPGSAFSSGAYDGRPCFIETRSISDVAVVRRVVIERARRLSVFLSAPKHPMLRSLRCQGFAVSPDENYLSFIFHLPAPGISPVSLRTLLSAKDGPVPSVTSRLQLALQLLQAVKYIHTAGWLHRNLRSENIVFFVQNHATAFINALPAPTIVGFAFSRLDTADFSEGAPNSVDGSESRDPARHIYCYPSYVAREITARFEAYMDVYSLSTVLVEIASWLPLSRIVKDVVDVKKSSVPIANVHKVRQYLIESLEHDRLKLRFRMGDVCANVIKQCLTIGEIDTDQTLEILETAMAELQKCYI